MTNVLEGDLWQLGDHRLLCGDCTVPDDVNRLMQGEKVDMVLTDPPYGVSYSEKQANLNKIDSGQRLTRPIINDDLTEYRGFFATFLRLVPYADYNTVYVFMASQHLHDLRLAMDDAGLKFTDCLVWVKNRFVFGRKDYKGQHEMIVYGWHGHHKFYGGHNRSTTLHYPSLNKNKLHPTEKPRPLLERLIMDGSMPGMIVYDAFAGSGSTLLACETQRRQCRCIEIDPYYCEVIISRWEAQTGKKARLIKE